MKLPLAAFSAIFLLSCSSSSGSMDTVTLSSGSEKLTLRIEIADEPEELAKGLMERTELPEGTGMLFIFAQEQVLTFWMKNTVIPLDVIYFDHTGAFVSAHSMDPCPKNSLSRCPMFSSGSPAMYALEVPQGYAAKHGIGSGWMMEL